MDRRLFALTIVGILALSGCSSADSGYKPGELGNGGFYFSCNDAVSCTRYSNDASKFPQAVSLGSSFQVRFVSKPEDSSRITFNESAPERGITISAVGEYLTKGPAGLVAAKIGYATILSRDASGQLVDFVNLRVAKPDALVIYAADDTSENPNSVDTVTLSRSETRSYRAFAQEKKSVLAGSLTLDWTSDEPSVVDIASTAEGKVTVIARSAGSAKLRATLSAVGGPYVQEIPIVVKP